MNNTWGTQDQPPPIPGPAQLCPEHVSLGLAIVAITTSTVALAVEQLTAVVVFRGAYSVLAGLFVAGFVGWVVGAAERRVRRELGGAVAELTTELAELRKQVTQQRITYLPAPRRHGEGQRYIGSVAVERTSPVDQDTIGLDPECIDAARRITSRLRAVDNE